MLPSIEDLIQSAQEIHFSNEKLHFLFEKHPIVRYELKNESMKQTIVSNAASRNQILKQLIKKERGFIKYESDKLKQIQFDIDMDEGPYQMRTVVVLNKEQLIEQ